MTVVHQCIGIKKDSINNKSSDKSSSRIMGNEITSVAPDLLSHFLFKIVISLLSIILKLREKIFLLKKLFDFIDDL